MKITQQVLLSYISPFSGNLKTKGQKITYSLSRNLLMSQDQPLLSAFYFSILDSHRTPHVHQQLSKLSVLTWLDTHPALQNKKMLSILPSEQ